MFDQLFGRSHFGGGARGISPAGGHVVASPGPLRSKPAARFPFNPLVSAAGEKLPVDCFLFSWLITQSAVRIEKQGAIRLHSRNAVAIAYRDACHDKDIPT